MTHIPKVSICIPAYEQPEFLYRAVNSVFDQSFQDFEIIITDDSETNLVEEVLKSWKDDVRLIYHRNSVRLGSPENWNAAMRLACTDLIKFLHHDDWFTDENSLEQFVSAMDCQNINFAFSAANACEDDGSLIFLHLPSDSNIDLLRREPKLLQFANFIGAPSATIFRKKDGFKFDANLKWVVDIDAYIVILGEKPQFKFISEPLVSIASNGEHQVTRTVANDSSSRVKEHLYLYYKHRPDEIKNRIKGSFFIFGLISGFTLNEIKMLNTLRNDHKKTSEEKFIMKLQLTKTEFLNYLKRAKSRAFRTLKKEQAGRKSYSQCGEDMIVDFLMMWIGVKDVHYLDIGANHPTWLSNTYYFYNKGARGVLIEPDDDLCKGLTAKRPKDRILNLAVGIEGDGMIDMYVMSSRTLNTLDRNQAEALQANTNERIEYVRKVRSLGINELIAHEFVDTKPNYVSLDIEGLDFDILKSWDFSRCRPEVFCVETLTYSKTNSEEKLQDIISLMTASGYMTYADTYVNTIFVSEDVWNKRPIYA